MNISVAMAVYNGERYIEDQVNSILTQLRDGDEIIISYDKSNDNTYRIISDLAKKSNYIKIVEGPLSGVVKNFENAILNCQNEYIFLCDQDDIWFNNKIDEVLKVFRLTNADLVIHDAVVTDARLQVINSSFFSAKGCKKGFWRNLVKNSYIGCCMAFNQNLKSKIIPFPRTIPMHDQWIGMVAELKGKVEFLSKPLIYYRRHGQNVTSTKRSNITSMIKYRAGLIIALLKKYIV